jgi:ATP-dependent helicase YprA (DUF1998 family)
MSVRHWSMPLKGLRFLVLDELHTYRGRQGADVAMLVRRVRNALNATNLQCIGTSATLAGAGSMNEQRQEVSVVASMLFGDKVLPEHVIGETLRRSTREFSSSEPGYRDKLKQCILTQSAPTSYEELVEDPLASWIESNLGINTDPASGRLLRAQPRGIQGPDGAAHQLAELTGLSETKCAQALMHTLLAGYGIPNPETGLPAFAFRLHQFISRGDTVYASLEPETDRYLTVHGQQYVPNDRSRVLLPLVFCRECGQEYYVVRKVYDRDSGATVFTRANPKTAAKMKVR